MHFLQKADTGNFNFAQMNYADVSGTSVQIAMPAGQKKICRSEIETTDL